MSFQGTVKAQIDPENILEFWFGDAPDDVAEAQRREAFWFGAKPKTDSTIRHRFARTVKAAGRGELKDWLDDARSALALVVVLDQFPLNIWRGTVEAYAFEAQALDVARYSVAAGYVARLAPIESAFLILPYQHSESIERQRESVQIMAKIAGTAAPVWHTLMDNYLKFAMEHLAIIERFGRFPHRNRVLGRVATEAEEAYLAAGGATYGQG
jgi:uncharacterized protein (DUF924 family)